MYCWNCGKIVPEESVFCPACGKRVPTEPKRYRSIVDQVRVDLGGDFLSVNEVAEILNVSRDTVTLRFENLDGVVDLGHEETRQKRRYRNLRIPRRVLEKYLKERTRRHRYD
jgi:Mn-dependent DtxR family transcriptional regulator